MAYTALYRKWRPKNFCDITGQQHITGTLLNEIVSGRIAHAYLFCGSRGTGKTTTAKVFSRAVNCLSPEDGNPCNKCRTCLGIDNGSLLDVVEIDAASNNGVENIRTINSEVSYMPSGVKYKIYIIDEVHMLSASAFNALLKTLEEPPAHVIFILATTESHKIPATILSRCQRFDFRRIGVSEIKDRLKTVAEGDGLQTDDAALSLIAKAADGSMRDAISMLDQCASARNGVIDEASARIVTGRVDYSRMFSLCAAVAGGDADAALRVVNAALNDGYDAVWLLLSIIELYRNVMIVKSCADTGGLIDMSAEELSELGKTAASYNIERVMSILDILSASYDTAKYSSMPRLVCEMAIIRAAYKNPDAPAPSLKEEPAPITETIPEVKEEEEIVGDAALNVPHKIEIEKAEEEIKQPSDGVSSIIDNWDDIVSLIAREGGGYISSSIKSCEFRVNGDRLTILDTMLANKPEYTSAVEKAVFDICGARVKVEFQTFDLLKKVAGELDGQIKIIG